MKTEPTIKQIRETLSRLDDRSILSSLPLMRKMALVMGGHSSAAIMAQELRREGVKRGIME